MIKEKSLLEKVLPFYSCALENSTVTTLGNGLINETFLVRNNKKSFVLQKINHHVFKKPAQVINNAERINKHLQTKKEQGLYSLEPMWQIASIQNSPMVTVNNGFWRAIKFIPNCYTVEAVDTTEQATQVATAFGMFTSTLNDFSPNNLSEIIPDFHNLAARIAQLHKVVKADKHNRLKDCQSLVDYCLSQQAFITTVTKLVEKLPVQVTHNDTKINNLLFSSATKEPIAVIDLDTCMPGFIMHDFGDMVRTCCSNLPEDGKQLDEMFVRIDIFEALATAYIKSFKGSISLLEQQSLVIGAQLLPFMIGVRFLTDFIDGDNYFHTNYNTHNLDRASNQLHFYTLLNELEEQLTDIVLTNVS